MQAAVCGVIPQYTAIVTGEQLMIDNRNVASNYFSVSQNDRATDST
jgi:hypothetical protein